jgi:hypothetical protein
MLEHPAILFAQLLAGVAAVIGAIACRMFIGVLLDTWGARIGTAFTCLVGGHLISVTDIMMIMAVALSVQWCQEEPGKPLPASGAFDQATGPLGILVCFATADLCPCRLLHVPG